MIPLVMGGEPKVGEDGTPEVKADGSTLATVLTALRYICMLGMYGGFTGVCVGASIMEAPKSVYPDGAPPVSPAVACTMNLCFQYFAIYLAIAVLQTYHTFNPPTEFTKKVDKTFTLCRNTVSFAPMLCILFIGARMRALQLDPVNGNPQKWAQNCFYMCAYSVLVQVCIILLIPFALDGTANEGETARRDLHDREPDGVRGHERGALRGDARDVRRLHGGDLLRVRDPVQDGPDAAGVAGHAVRHELDDPVLLRVPDALGPHHREAVRAPGVQGAVDRDQHVRLGSCDGDVLPDAQHPVRGCAHARAPDHGPEGRAAGLGAAGHVPVHLLPHGAGAPGACPAVLHGCAAEDGRGRQRRVGEHGHHGPRDGGHPVPRVPGALRWRGDRRDVAVPDHPGDCHWHGFADPGRGGPGSPGRAGVSAAIGSASAGSGTR